MPVRAFSFPASASVVSAKFGGINGQTENLMIDFVWIAFAGLFGFLAAARDNDLAVFALPQPATTPDPTSYGQYVAVFQGLTSIESIASGHSCRAPGARCGWCSPGQFECAGHRTTSDTCEQLRTNSDIDCQNLFGNSRPVYRPEPR